MRITIFEFFKTEGKCIVPAEVIGYCWYKVLMRFARMPE